MSHIRRARLLGGLTQAELARRLGVARETACLAEKRGAGVSLRTLEKYAGACGYRVVVSFEPRDE